MAARESDGTTACERFRQIVNDRFRFLLTVYGFEEAEIGCDGGDMWVVFRTAVSQVNVHFEYWSEVWLTVGRAIDGEAVNLDYLLRLRAPDREKSYAIGDFDPQQIDEIMQ